jgi:branched-chain amino acid transport system substrate-binding protein
MSHQLKLMVASALLGWTVIGNAADIKVGVAEALTGPAAKYGVAIKNGFTLAADGINARWHQRKQKSLWLWKTNKVRKKKRSMFSKN